MRYVNLGDTYDTTIIREGSGPLEVASWGGWYEAVEAEHCESENEVRCGHCGEFTPLDRDNWSDVTCDSCGRNVSDGTKRERHECAECGTLHKYASEARECCSG